MNKKKRKILFCTYSDLDSGSRGDSVNDLKLFATLPKEYNLIKLFESS